MQGGPLDLIISGVRPRGRDGLADIGIRDGRIAAIAPRIEAEVPRVAGNGALAFPGFVEAHIHLDKAHILDRCPIVEGTLAEAVRLTAAAKAAFTVEDVYARARLVVEAAIGHGTTQMRTFVEVDPRAGLRSFEALRQVKADYARAIDIELCAFAQEGLTNEPETLELLEAALRDGADLVGGCPYTDPDPVAHVGLIFELAEKYGVAADFHLDFSLDPGRTDLPAVIAETRRRRYGGRVAVGHMTNLSVLAPAALAEIAEQLRDAGIAVVVLPATDLHLMGRGIDRLVPRGLAPGLQLAAAGVTVAVASNNILNPFTPIGDASLGRMANLAANLWQAGSDAEMLAVFEMVTADAAKLLGRPYGLEIGAPADIVLLDAPDAATAVRSIASPLAGWKRGRKSFGYTRPEICR